MPQTETREINQLMLARLMQHAPVIPNGRFTFTNADGDHKTFMIRTQEQDKEFAPGERILSLFTGTQNDNPRHYKGFAFVKPDGQIFVWRSKRGSDSPSIYEAYAKMVQVMCTQRGNNWYEENGYTLMVEKRCCKCNRVLTTPESLEAGIGPVCAGISSSGRD